MNTWNCRCVDYTTQQERVAAVIEAPDEFDALRQFRAKHAAARVAGVAVYIVKRNLLHRLFDLCRFNRVDNR